MIHVQADSGPGSEVITDAAAVGLDVVDAIQSGHERTGPIAVIEVVPADAADGIDPAEHTLRQRDVDPDEDVIGLVGLVQEPGYRALVCSDTLVVPNAT